MSMELPRLDPSWHYDTKRCRMEPEYYLSRCTGDAFEAKRVTEELEVGFPTDRNTIIATLVGIAPIEDEWFRTHHAEMLALVESGADLMEQGVYRELIALLKTLG